MKGSGISAPILRSSLAGYLDKRKRAGFVDCSMVLGEYGGDTDQARAEYKKLLYRELSDGIDMSEGMVGSTIIGTEGFVTWVRETFLKGKNEREQPSVGSIYRTWSREAILAAVERESGKNVDAIKKDKGDLRRVVMELLYRKGRLKGPEIGAIFGMDYSTVSQERKRLTERIAKDPELGEFFKSFESALSTSKI